MGKKNFKCKLCNKTFVSYSHVKRHALAKHLSKKVLEIGTEVKPEVDEIIVKVEFNPDDPKWHNQILQE